MFDAVIDCFSDGTRILSINADNTHYHELKNVKSKEQRGSAALAREGSKDA